MDNGREARDHAIASHAGAAFYCELARQWADLLAEGRGRILIAGSGEGHEAQFIRHELQSTIIAMDSNLGMSTDTELRMPDRFVFASMDSMPFEDSSFDSVFCYHVLEHVRNPDSCIAEIARVLAPNGVAFFGTPNRHRLVSAIGSYDNPHWKSSLANKLKENLGDWTARLRGRFRNELGAHAGYSQRELDRMLSSRFANRRWLTRDYLAFKYKRHALFPIINLAAMRPQIEFLAPSIYVLCRKSMSQVDA